MFSNLAGISYQKGSQAGIELTVVLEGQEGAYNPLSNLRSASSVLSVNRITTAKTCKDFGSYHRTPLGTHGCVPFAVQNFVSVVKKRSLSMI